MQNRTNGNFIKKIYGTLSVRKNLPIILLRQLLFEKDISFYTKIIHFLY